LWRRRAGGEGLALGSRRGLALPRDDLQRDVEPVALVAASQTDPEPPLPSGAQRPVAVGDELAAVSARAGSDTILSFSRASAESCARRATR
jgi:hypothetical protein